MRTEIGLGYVRAVYDRTPGLPVGLNLNDRNRGTADHNSFRRSSSS